MCEGQRSEREQVNGVNVGLARKHATYLLFGLAATEYVAAQIDRH